MAENETTFEDVAKWMIERINERKTLYHQEALRKIKEKFGNDFVYRDEYTNLCIHKKSFI